MLLHDIAVVGAGISGLHLALGLQARGIPVTLYAAPEPDALRHGPLLNTVGRMPHTLEREHALGIAHWRPRTTAVEVTIHGPQPLSFGGRLNQGWSFVDLRVYLARLLEDFAERGGRVVPGSVETDDVAALGDRHPLVVVAIGRRSLTELFPVVAERSPYTRPQRRLCAAFVGGLAPLEGDAFGFHVVPGVGELFHSSFDTVVGPATCLLFEGIPGSSFAALSERHRAADPRAFDRAMLDALRAHVPDVAALAEPAVFGVLRPLDLLQGAVVPAVRRAWTVLPSGRCALAIGDAWITNDPVTGQGANLGSWCAAEATEAIADGGPFDARFCARLEDRMWARASAVVDWTNAFLQPPPPHAIELFATAARRADIADAFVSMFNDPVAMWRTVASPAGIAQLLQPRTDVLEASLS